jgi:Arylsulfotransferase (ASST)
MRNAGDVGPELTRRRFLAAGGLAVVGVAGIGVFLEACSSATPSASGAAGPSAPAASGSPTPVVRRTYKSRPDLSAPPVDVVSPVGNVAPGFVFLTPNNGLAPNGLLMTDNAGKPVWIRPDTGSFAANFRPSVYGGKPVLTWWEGATNGGYGSGQLVIADDTYTELLRFGAGQGRKADIHEFQITPQQTALLLTDQGVPIAAGATPPPYQNWDCIVIELDIQTGAVLFEWHSADHIDPSESVLPAPGTAGSPIPTATPFAPPTPGGSAAAPTVPVYDSVHANGIELDTDGHLLVSARNTSAIYKVDRSTGNILWRLGGKKSDFKMGDGTSFGLQHDPRRHADGTLSIFDDGTTGPSRGIVLDVDEVAMTATLVKEYPHPHGKFAMSQGNMEILPNGNIFVGWGSTGTASEFTTDGQVQFDADFSGSIQSYRCFRYPWVAQPKEPPDVVADAPSGGMTNVYASWNGATEVATWEVLGGTDATALSSLGTFPRTDFETVLAVKATSGLIAVNALDKTGTVLGTSKAVPIPD